MKENHLSEMVQTLKHRGPDANDYYFDREQGWGIGHTRLSILDLSTRANQPMKSQCGKYIIAFNGEVYNFKQLRKKLSNEYNLSFRTTSDTEVILEAFVHWGSEFVDELNGMFSIAIYDLEHNEYYIWRDRLGIKPLYYYLDEDVFLFSSELKSLLIHDVFNHSIDYEALGSYLQLGFIPGDRTAYTKIWKLEPGSFLKVSSNLKVQIERYYQIDAKYRNNIISEEKPALNQTRSIIENAVSKRLVSDVPVGSFLSGGIDSTLITAIANEYYEGQLKTFNIGFSNAVFDETKYAREIAKYLGTDHHEYILNESEAIELLADHNNTFDEPFADSSAIPTMLVSKMAKQEVKVALSGDGGDELFFGYGHHVWAKRMSSPWFDLVRGPLRICMMALGNSRYKRVSHLLKRPENGDDTIHIFSQEQYNFSIGEIPRYCKEGVSPFCYVNSVSNRHLNAIERQAHFDLTNYLPEDLLVKVDRSSMKFGLEVRVPLLDHELVEYAVNLHQNLKIRNGVSKYLLKQILFNYVPAKYFDRPKWGFSIPLGRWLKGELAYLMEDHLNQKRLDETNIFNTKEVLKMVHRFKRGDDFLYQRIWQIIVVQKWLKEYH